MKNITARITTIRHGRKNEHGHLHDEGKKQAAHRAVSIEHLDGDLILFHSGEKRVRDTINIIGGNISKKSIDEVIDMLNTEHDLQDYVVPTLHFLKNKEEKSEYFSEWTEDINDSRIIGFIDKKSDFNDFKRAYSSIEMAKNLANVIYTQIKFSELTDSKYKTNFINGTHEPVIMSFLYYLLTDFRADKSISDFISEIGGSVNYAEGFDIVVYQEGLKVGPIEFSFRNIKKNLDLKLLAEFANS